MQFSFELSYSDRVNVVESILKWEIWNGSTWITLGSYSNLNGALEWAPYSYDVSTHAANRVFKIRFVASGADSDHIHYWGLDNIQLGGSDTGVVGLSIARVGTNIVLNWTAVPGANWYRIYASANPYGGFTPLTSKTIPSASIPLSSLSGNKRFFKVTSGTGPTP